MCVQFAQTVLRAEYIQHLYDLFENFVGTPPRVYTCGAGTRVYKSIQFRTYSHAEFKFYDNLFYSAAEGGRKKRVPKNLHELLTARSLAYWFTDDGTFYTINQKRYFVLNTQFFILSDLVEALSHNFGIHASIKKASSYYKLYIREKYTQRFVDLIRPYLQTCFAYKIQDPPLSFSWGDPAKRSRLLAHPERVAGRPEARRRHLRCK